ncbi:MAG: sulfotransferase family protein [Solirubrobacteraceae bacterium]
MAAGPGRIPDFFVVGHPKSGTTALSAMLSQHPQVFVGENEPRFFAPELRLRDFRRTNETPKDLDEYKAWHAGAAPDQIVGDVTPSYLWSKQAAELIAKAQPEARIIALLREPASFLRSFHLQLLQSYTEVESDFQKALALEEPRRRGESMPRDSYWPNLLFYSEHVRYVEQLRRFHERFPRERVRVLIYDDYKADNEATIRSVFRFLEVEEIPIRVLRVKPTVEVRTPGLNSLLRRLTVADQGVFAGLNRSIKALTPMRARQGLLHAVRRRFVYAEPEPPDEVFMAELRQRLKPEVVALSEYLDRDMVALWGYDRLS